MVVVVIVALIVAVTMLMAVFLFSAMTRARRAFWRGLEVPMRVAMFVIVRNGRRHVHRIRRLVRRVHVRKVRGRDCSTRGLARGFGYADRTIIYMLTFVDTAIEMRWARKTLPGQP